MLYPKFHTDISNHFAAIARKPDLQALDNLEAAIGSFGQQDTCDCGLENTSP